MLAFRLIVIRIGIVWSHLVFCPKNGGWNRTFWWILTQIQSQHHPYSEIVDCRPSTIQKTRMWFVKLASVKFGFDSWVALHRMAIADTESHRTRPVSFLFLENWWLPTGQFDCPYASTWILKSIDLLLYFTDCINPIQSYSQSHLWSNRSRTLCFFNPSISNCCRCLGVS